MTDENENLGVGNDEMSEGGFQPEDHKDEGVGIGGFGSDEDTRKDGESADSADAGESSGADKGADMGESEKPKDAVSSISDRLSKKDMGDTNSDENTANPKEAMPFDLTKITPEQLSVLKQMLGATPDRITKKRGNDTVKLHDMNGKLVVAWKKSYQSLLNDPVERRAKNVAMLPVLFKGDTEYTDVVWADFMASDRVVCEVLTVRIKKDVIEEGETVSRQSGTVIAMEKTMIEYFFTIKTPSGEEFEINSKFVN